MSLLRDLFPRYEKHTKGETHDEMIAKARRNMQRTRVRRGARLKLLPEPLRSWKVNAIFHEGHQIYNRQRRYWTQSRGLIRLYRSLESLRIQAQRTTP